VKHRDFQTNVCRYSDGLRALQGQNNYSKTVHKAGEYLPQNDTSCIFDLSLEIACHSLRTGNVKNIAVLMAQ